MELFYFLLVFYVTSGADAYFINTLNIRFIDIGLISLLLVAMFIKDRDVEIPSSSIIFFIFMIAFITIYTLLGTVNSSIIVGFTYYKLVLKNLFIFLISSMAFMQFNRRKFIFILITNGILISFLIINDWVNHLHLLNNATYFYRSSSILGNPNI